MARRIYGMTPQTERDAKKKHLDKILSVSERTVPDWLSRIDKDAKEARNLRIFEMWLGCWTNIEISDECNCDEKTVREIIGKTQSCQNSEHKTEPLPITRPTSSHRFTTSGSSNRR